MPVQVAAYDASKANFAGRFTWYSFVCCLVAASGGLLFGYDLGVAGGVSTMADFQQRFFPSIYDNTQHFTQTSPWCAYDSQTLSLFQSSLFLAALVAALVGSQTGHKYGRRTNMMLAGLFYLAGAALNGAAYHISMIIIGRLLLGAGVGLANSSVTIYANEMAPAKYRGGLNMLFQLCTTIGIVVAQLINWALEPQPWGWRLSLGIAGLPALIILAGSFLLPESPTWLIEKGHDDEAKRILLRARGITVEELEAEFADMQLQTQVAKETSIPFLKIFKACYVPHLLTSFFIAAGQQLTGINSIMFYISQIFSTIGSGRRSALEQACVMGAVNVAATFVGMYVSDRFGRRKLFVVSGICMGILEILCGALINHYFIVDSGKLTSSHANVILAIICLYVANFAWSFGPLGWLVPSEIQPAEIRTAGMSFATATNMAFTFIIGQAFLKMMCNMRQGVFYFFAGWCLIQAVYYQFFLPETKGRHIEQVHAEFQKHWFWKRFPPVPRQAADVREATLAHEGAEQGGLAPVTPKQV